MIIAPPHFLGMLRERLGALVKRRVLAEIPNDFVHRETDDIAKAIARYLNEAPAS